MKREIVCVPCRPKAFVVTPSTDPLILAEMYANGEETRVVQGSTVGSSRCDRCNKELPTGSQALAISYITKHSPYFEWESDYVSPTRSRRGE